jgi:hypothetical protein
VTTINADTFVARVYLAAGWSPIPLPAGQKWPPPNGVTGWNGRYTTTADLTRQGWDWTGNIGIRLPPDVIGIDIDAYNGGLAALAELEQRYGPLPPTVLSTSRTDGSAIGLYRVPVGTTLATDPAEGVDIIQPHHRYVVCAPSTHPKTLCPYRWIDEQSGDTINGPPNPGELPDLPWTWIQGLAVDKQAGAGAATPAAAKTFVQTHTARTRPAALDGIRTRLSTVRPGGRHDALVTVTCWAMREAAAGLYTADEAINTIHQWWITAVEPHRRQSGEFGGAVLWAIGQADGDPARIETIRDNPSSNGDRPHDDDRPAGLDIVDWTELFAGITHEDPIIEGVAYRGRWTSYVAPGKAGKSTWTINLAVALQAGLEPFDRTPCPPINVLYLDAEMGRVDIHERLEDLGHTPQTLGRLHYTDLVPKLDTVAGASRLHHDIERLHIGLVIIDGVNGAVGGAEKDDVTWRDFYDLTIAPLKRVGIAIVTNDNLGKNVELGPRGSSVKIDKPDAVIQLHRTDDGVKLVATHRRTAAYPADAAYTVHGVDGDTPITFKRSQFSWPAGTKAKADELDALGIPPDMSNHAVREALKAAGHTIGKSEVLAAAIRWRRMP